MKLLREQPLLSNRQYGFISGRSTTTQLLNYLDGCINTIVNGGIVDSLYFDFVKAFDTVPHRRLMSKLQAYGIQGKMLAWIKEFLCGRTQLVKVNGVTSDTASVLSGIPQGTVLGSLLFILYINDILDNIDSEGFLFADDMKIFHAINCRNDANILKYDIKELENWSRKWLLNFHPEKCHVLTLGKFENIKHTERFRINDTEMEHVFDEKDLGVVIDSELTFEEHISKQVKKANSIL